jgi:hypothetical protein
VWPNRCSTAINTANELLQKSVEGQERMHYIDMGPVGLSSCSAVLARTEQAVARPPVSCRVRREM